MAAGKQRVRIASLIQFTVPGAPTVYYGDEVGMTGDDDPDDRRTYPWADLGGTPDTQLLAHYTALAKVRREQRRPDRTATSRRSSPTTPRASSPTAARRATQAALVVVNRGGVAATVDVPVAGYLPRRRRVQPRRTRSAPAASASATVGGRQGQRDRPGQRRACCSSRGSVDLDGPGGPGAHPRRRGQRRRLDLAWNAVAGAVSYNVYAAPSAAAAGVKANASPSPAPRSPTPASTTARDVYFVVTALDAAGNASAPVERGHRRCPHYAIGWANLQWPPTMTHTISAVNRTDNAYGQVWIDGVTNQPGATPGLRAQLGFGPDGCNPAGNAAWTWVDGAFNTDAGNNDEFMASLLPEAVGQFDYAYRYTTTGGRDWLYADLDGIGNGYSAGAGRAR